MLITSFIFFLLIFVAIGVASTKFHQKTTEDYLLASKNVKPWLVGFSFFATENSGFMFVGFIGLVIVSGLSALWMPVGWYVGEVVMLWFTAKKIRQKTNVINAETYSELLSKWTGREMKLVRRFSALLIMVFLGVYGAAQLSAGSKALNVLMGWDYSIGALIGFFIVLAYCAAGGIRASIWTDAAQAIVMLVSLIVIVIAGLSEVGGYGELFAGLEAADQKLIHVFPPELKYGFILFFLGWFFAGIGVLGQAHVMVRFMVIDKAEHVRQALFYYIGMVSVLLLLCLTVGLICRVMLPELASGDPELGMPMLSAELLPDILTGLVLAGLFAAAISTADSQILSSAAAFSCDLLPIADNSYFWSKVGTVLVASLALFIVLAGYDNVFALVTFAWSVMASGFAPLLIMLSLGKKPGELLALITMFVGIAASVAWKYSDFADHIYNVLPGLVAGLVTYLIAEKIIGTTGDTNI